MFGVDIKKLNSKDINESSEELARIVYEYSQANGNRPVTAWRDKNSISRVHISEADKSTGILLAICSASYPKC